MDRAFPYSFQIFKNDLQIGRFRMTRAGFKAWAVASGAALLLVSGAGSASAQTTRTSSCFTKVDGGRTITGNPWVKVKNTCAWGYKVKAIWKFGPDSTCKLLSEGQTRRYESTPPAVYERTDICG
ncbi:MULTISPECIES: hypothetical protein [unclassified Nonomuraea]|uniref:hypothetical protein n=1 Tax=unclassified Nonomuraea TaxID=2593643 RepID=UPI0033EA1B9D